MSVITKYTLKSLKAHKIRTMVTIAGVALAAALFTAVLACVSSLNGFLLKAEVAMSGDWTAYVYTDTLDQAHQGVEQDPQITNWFTYIDVGFAPQPEEEQNNYGNYLSVLSAEGSWPLVALQPEEGRFPEKADEIMLPTRFLGEPLFNVDEVQIGSTLTFDMGDRQLIALQDGVEGYTSVYAGFDTEESAMSFDVDDLLNSSQSYAGSAENGSSLGERVINLKEKTYTVVGFYYDKGYGGLTHSGMYAALTYQDPEAQGFSATYVKTDELNSRDGIISNLENAFGSSYVTPHDSLLRYMGIVDDRSLWSSLESITIILGIIIAVACVALVSNAFTISVTERIKQFGLLASLGATKRQLSWSVIEEALIIAVVGTPLGILLGLGATALTLYLLNPSIMEVLGATWVSYLEEPLGFTLVVNPMDLGIAALVTVLVVVISAAIPAVRAYRLNPIDAIRDVSSVRKTKSIETSRRAVQKPWSGGIAKAVFGIPGKIAALNTQRSKGKHVVVSLSLALAVVLLMTGGAVSTTFGTLLDAMHLEQNYDLVVVGSVDEAKNNEEVLAQGYESMQTSSSAEGLGWNLEAPVVLTVSPSIIGPDALSYGLGDMSREVVVGATEPLDVVGLISFVDDDTYRTWLQENAIDEKKIYAELEQGNLAAVGISEGYGDDGSKYVLQELFTQTGSAEIIYPGLYPSGEDIFDFFYDYAIHSNDKGVLTTVAFNMLEIDEVEKIDVSELEDKKMSLCIAALAPNRPRSMNQGSGVLTLVAPMSALKLLPNAALNNETSKFRAAFNANDTTAAAEAITDVAEELWAEHFPDMYTYVDNAAERAKSTNLLATVVNIFCLLFTCVLMLIALAGLFTTVTNNLVLRAREFAVLQSVGLGPKDFRKMVVSECVGYGVRGIIPGLILSFIVSLALYYALSASVGGLTYMFPWSYALLAVALIAAMVTLSVAYGMHCLKAQTPAEVLSGE